MVQDVSRPDDIKQVLDPGQYTFVNCEKPDCTLYPIIIKYLADTEGVAEFLEVAIPGRAWVALGSILSVGTTPSKWYLQRVDSEWYRCVPGCPSYTPT